jgi:hypothetical protein
VRACQASSCAGVNHFGAVAAVAACLGDRAIEGF